VSPAEPDPFELAAGHAERLERRRRWRVNGRMLTTLAGGSVASMVILLLILRPRGGRLDLRIVLPFACVIAIALLCVFLLPRVVPGTPSPLWSLARSRRRAVARAVRTGHAAPDPTLAAVALEQIALQRRIRWLPALWGALGVFFLGLGLSGSQPWWLTPLAAICMWLGVTSYRANRRLGQSEAANRALLDSDL
jgi:hypothetical protein